MKSRQAGMTALEIMVAVLILTFALIPIISVLRMLRGSLEDRIIENKIVLYGQSLMDEIRSKKWDENSDPFTFKAVNPSPNLGPEQGQNENPTNFDDVDDYDEFLDNPEPGTTRSADVKYVALPVTAIDGNMIDSPGGAVTDYKFIKVTVKFEKSKTIVKTFENIMANTPY